VVVLLGAAALLLCATGLAKIRRPEPTRDALHALRLPSGRLPAFALGGSEIVVGVAAVAWRVPLTAAALAALYAAFAVVVVAALRSGGLVSCGCAGRDDTPPTVVHLVVDVAFVGVGVAAAISGAPWLGVLAVPYAFLLAWTCWVALTVFPRVVAGRRALHEAV
jgi:uncharacterized membrane protein YphA (DoxX/SURF4 family)